MERIIFTSLLLTAVLSSSAGALRQYHFVNQQKSWTEAQRYCREKHTDLVTINDMQEQNDTKQAIERVNSNVERVWIGLKSTNTWIWSRDPAFYSGGDLRYKNWENSQPKENGDCVLMNNEGKWNDRNCSFTKYFICYNDSSKGIVPVMEQKNWTDAQKYCRENHTDLVSVRNDTENEQIKHIIKQNITSSNETWIGLHRLWVWSDSSSSTFTHWLTGEPNEKNNRDICTSMGIKDHQGLWTDEPCTRDCFFVCYDDNMVLVRENKTWAEALRHCRNNGMDLVSVDSEQMQRWVKMTIMKANVSTLVWLGLRHSCTVGIWFWVNGQTVCYDQWTPDYDKDLNECEKTVRSGAIQKSDNKWISCPETDRYNFICSK